jgi:acyl carrier protein
LRIKPDVNLRGQLDLDSVDYLNFVIGLSRAFDLDILEADYPSLYRLDVVSTIWGARCC